MTITTRITTMFIAVAALLTAVAGAAVAAPSAPGSPRPRHSVRVIAPDDTVIVCVVTAAPVPQYSTAGGPRGSIHFGAHMFCDTPGTLVVTTELFEQQVNHPGSPLNLEATRYLNGAGTSIGSSWSYACFTNVQMAWVSYIYASWNGIAAQPDPLSSGNQLLTCE